MKTQISNFKTQNLCLKLLVFLTFNFALLTFSAIGGPVFGWNIISEVHAQTIDPALWQTGATGLKTTTNSNEKTAGLTTTIQLNNNLPFVVLQGGVENTGYGQLTGPTGIELGEIKNPNVSSVTLNNESADWSHDQMAFTTNLSNQLNLWVSRLSPAILIQNSTSSLRLFSGNLRGATFQPSEWAPYTPQVTNRTPAPSYPKYIAFQSGGTVRVLQIPASGASALNLPTLDNNWILVWYGNNSHFTDLKLPLSYTFIGWGDSIYSHTQGFLADVPLLLKFQNNPSSIKQSSEGGIDLTFTTNSGYTSLMPILGRDHPKASDTDGWYSALDLINHNGIPTDVLTKINFWTSSNRLCSYPTQVAETYAYDTNSDTSSITENITYLPVCNGGSATSGFATLPPALSLAKDAVKASISGPPAGGLTDPNYATEFGPILGIDNTNSYSWAVSGLKKYIDSKRIIPNVGQAPPELVQKLISEVDKVTQNGHYLPWVFDDHKPYGGTSNVYFMNPADVIYYLIEIAQALPDSQTKTNLINYLKSERSSFPPETVYNLPNTGTRRTSFTPADPTVYPSILQSTTNYLVLKRLPLYNFLALSRYYDLTGEPIPSSVISAAKNTLNADMAEQDWATFSWFKGFDQRRVTVLDSNRHLDGLIGYIKLMKSTGDIAEGLGRVLFTKAVVQRVALAKYPRYQYSANLINLPSDPAWMIKGSPGQAWRGFIWNYNWTSSFDDPQQVVAQDQFGSYLYDDMGYVLRGWAWNSFAWSDYPASISQPLATYNDMIPETFRLMTDFAKADLEITLNKYTTIFPNWFQAFQEGVIGFEHDLTHPKDSFQLFMAKTFIQKDNPDNLRRYKNVSWLDSGDFFYMQKLAETIKAYQGVRWEDEPVLGVSTKASPSFQPPTFNILDLIKATLNKILNKL